MSRGDPNHALRVPGMHCDHKLTSGGGGGGQKNKNLKSPCEHGWPHVIRNPGCYVIVANDTLSSGRPRYGSFVSTGACNLEVPVSNPVGPDICHRGCAYTVLQTVQRNGVYSAAYGTVHYNYGTVQYKEPLKSFKIRVGHSLGFGLLSVAIPPWLCRKRCKAIFNMLFLTWCHQPTWYSF